MRNNPQLNLYQNNEQFGPQVPLHHKTTLFIFTYVPTYLLLFSFFLRETISSRDKGEPHILIFFENFD